MKTYCLPRDGARLPVASRTVVLGIFDGVHAGHRKVITTALTQGKGNVSLYTFIPGTVSVKPSFEQICTADEQKALLDAIGVQEMIEDDFSRVREYSPARFVTDILDATLHACRVVCGYNYRFGKDGAGDTQTLCALCKEQGIAVTVVPAVEMDGSAVNSTAIRTALKEGNIPLARRMLGRAPCLCGEVIHGKGLGNRLSMPTANQTIPPGLVIPRLGVYRTSVEIGDEIYQGVTNIGVRPTVEGSTTPIAETWIQGFAGDLYGKTVNVYLVDFLRDERPFSSVEELRCQVQADARETLARFTGEKNEIKAVIFDFDDTLYLRDGVFRQAVASFLDEMYPPLSSEEKQKRIEEMVVYNDYGYRMPVPYEEYIEKYLHEWEGGKPISAPEGVRWFFSAFASFCTLAEDTEESLLRLREQGYLVGILTNGSPFLQHMKLDCAGVPPLADMVVVSGEEKADKPSPVVFRRTANRLGVAPENCLYVGDNPVNDMEGALGAGMQPVWIDRGFMPDHPCYGKPIPEGIPVIHSLRELVQRIEKKNRD